MAHARGAERAHVPDADARRRGDVRRVARRDGAWRSQLDQFHEMFDGSSEPIGILLAAGVDVRRRRDRRPPRGVAAGEGRRSGASAAALLSLFGVTMLYFRVPFASYDYIVLSPDLAALVTVLGGRVPRQRDEPDRRPRRPRDRDRARSPASRCSSTRTGCSRPGSSRAPTSGRSSRSSSSAMCVGFLPHNFNPARIFMGDAGAMLLGLLLAVTTITDRRAHGRPVQRPDLLLLRAAASSRS